MDDAPPKRRKLQSPCGERRYRELFIIAEEGEMTEPQDFTVFNDQQSAIRVNCLKGSQYSTPPQVLEQMEDYLRTTQPRESRHSIDRRLTIGVFRSEDKLNQNET